MLMQPQGGLFSHLVSILERGVQQLNFSEMKTTTKLDLFTLNMWRTTKGFKIESRPDVASPLALKKSLKFNFYNVASWWNPTKVPFCVFFLNYMLFTFRNFPRNCAIGLVRSISNKLVDPKFSMFRECGLYISKKFYIFFFNIYTNDNSKKLYTHKMHSK